MTAQNSANKSVFYKFLPYYLNKVKYLRPQLIMSIIFSVLSYPAFMLIINILCPVERELLELSQYISDPTPEQYEMNMALLDKRSLLYSLLIAEIIIGVLSLVGLFIFTFVTTLRSFRCLHNKSVVDMDMSLPINHNTRFFGDLAAVFTVNILPHFIAILLAQILLQFADLSAFDTQGEIQAIVEAMMGPMAFTGLFMCIMEIAITLLLISFCGRLAEACIYPILINFAIPVIHLMTINLVESGVYGAVLYPSAISTAVGSAYPITASSPLGMMIMTLYSMMSIGCKGSVSDCGPIFRPEFGIPALLVTLACFAGAYFLIKYRRAERVGMPYVYKGMGLVIPGHRDLRDNRTGILFHFHQRARAGRHDGLLQLHAEQHSRYDNRHDDQYIYSVYHHGAYQRAEFPEVRAFRGKMGGDSRCVRADMPRAEYVERIRRGVLRPEPRQSGFGFHVIL